MSQLVNVNVNTPLRSPVVGVANYCFHGEVVGSNATTIFIDGRRGYTVALEPRTAGTIHATVNLAQSSTSSGAFIESNYQVMVARYSVSNSGIITISTGAYTLGAVSAPQTPTTNNPSNRINTNVILTPIDKSSTNRYPYIRVDTLGGGETNNWLVTLDVWTLPFKGV